MMQVFLIILLASTNLFLPS